MTREQLAVLGGHKVRKDAKLFQLFKTYITEDAVHIFPGGKLPSGCFGCQFANNFRKWQNHVLKDEKIEIMAGEKTYVLESPGYRVYFKGSVLSKDSDDRQWVEWITFAKGEKREERKAKFKTLPQALRPKEAKKADTGATPTEEPAAAEKKAPKKKSGAKKSK